MVVGAVVCELTDVFLWFVCGLYVGILRCPLSSQQIHTHCSLINFFIYFVWSKISGKRRSFLIWDNISSHFVTTKTQ